MVYNDRSALKDKSNLKSKQYQDFIHTLYRNDKDNLEKVDNLFVNTDPYQYQPAARDLHQVVAAPQPNYATYIAQQQAAGLLYRRKRQTFRPRFVSRFFAEREQDREEERVLRRKAFHSSQHRRHPSTKNHEE